MKSKPDVITFMYGELKVNVRSLNEPSKDAIKNFNEAINSIMYKL